MSHDSCFFKEFTPKECLVRFFNHNSELRNKFGS